MRVKRKSLSSGKDILKIKIPSCVVLFLHTHIVVQYLLVFFTTEILR